jgi:predicted Zn-dependent peptidase
LAFKRKALALLVCAAYVSTAGAAETRIADNLKHFTLDNGMNIFVYPRKDAPVFCGMIYVNAGSAEENAGDTGLAHLLEHMAFKGTPWIGTTDWPKERAILAKIEEAGEAIVLENAKQKPDLEKVKSLTEELHNLQEQAAQFIVPNEYDQIITRAGGTGVNASTSVDFTNYYMNLPSNQLELWAMMESERLLYPSWREFYKERDVVAEERRMRSEDNPDGKMYESYLTTSFVAHPYRNPTIGWMSDIHNLTIKKTNDFYRKWYVPENYIAVLVGDIDPEQARATLDKYFGGIPAVQSPPLATTVEPQQMGERRTQVRFDAQPQMVVGWHKPTYPDKDAYVIEVIQYLLTRTGRSSRLYERLVKKDNICQDVDSFTAPGDKYANTFAVQLVPRAPHTTAEAERALYEEIERIKREPISDEELDKIRNQIDSNFVQDLESNIGFARQLGYYFLVTRDPNVLDKLREEMKNVSPQDIMRVAQKYLVKENRNVVELVKSEPRPAQSGKPKAPTEIRPDDTTTSASQAAQTQESAQ